MLLLPVRKYTSLFTYGDNIVLIACLTMQSGGTDWAQRGPSGSCRWTNRMRILLGWIAVGGILIEPFSASDIGVSVQVYLWRAG